MPILDLQNDEHEFIRAGKIHQGIRVMGADGKEHPKDLDYFVLADAPDVIPHYGPKPQTLLIYLPFKERDKNLDAYYRLYRSGGLYCRGNGNYIEYAVDPNGTGEVVIRDGVVVVPYSEATIDYAPGVEVPCPGKNRLSNPLYPRCQECKAIAMFKFMIRDPKEPRSVINKRLVFYQLDTTSARNIMMLTGVMNVLASMNRQLGTGIAAIPLILRRVPGEISRPVDSKKNPGKKVMAKMPKHFLQLEIDPSYIDVGMNRLLAQVVSEKLTEIAALPSGEEDAEVVDGELYTIDAEEVDETIANAVADIEAMRDELPGDWKIFHAIVEQFYPGTYNSKDMERKVRKRLGLARTDKMELDQATWRAACDSVIETLTGSAQ